MIGFGAMDEVQVSEMAEGGDEMDNDEDDDDILMEFSDDSDNEFNPDDAIPPVSSSLSNQIFRNFFRVSVMSTTTNAHMLHS